MIYTGHKSTVYNEHTEIRIFSVLVAILDYETNYLQLDVNSLSHPVCFCDMLYLSHHYKLHLFALDSH